ncbi:dyf-17 [Pristionchus pacificus]|uniref:Dyf-17 n=1 Tax=Pristionchus pacificus TaxID=54126 RepID=A0A2A6C9N2_PRIPA|nr:dyf-17 [Pristionchus pacificus]|eukprot:PDM74922.1 dyf-17 [Pristionchus pacificus]
MSGILSEEREALRDVNQRISAIERRLNNARAARDSYLDYLRSKYPLWRPASIPAVNTSQVRFLEEPADIFSQLETSVHFWDLNRESTRRFGEVRGRLYNAIPSSGPLIESDLPRMRRRLDEINGQLRLLREHRSILPSEEYIRSTMPPPEPPLRENRDLMEIQERLSSMQFSSPPVFDISPERITELKKKEEMEKLMQDFREGRIPSVLGPPPIAPVNIPSYSVEAVERQSIVPPVISPIINPPSSSSIPIVDERTTAAPRVQFESSVKEEPKKAEEPKSEPPKSNYQQILSLLSNTAEDSEEEKKKKSGNTRSFDDIFGKPKPSSDSSKQISKQKPSMSMAMEADDSDDDFFQ